MDNNFQLLLQEPDEGVLVFALRGELDMLHADEVKDAVATAVGSGEYRRLVFDLTRLGFLDSSGIHILVDTHRKMQAARGDVTVVCASPNLARIFELTGLDRVLTIVPDRGSALALVA
jgi:anti-anti-sigma factor